MFTGRRPLPGTAPGTFAVPAGSPPPTLRVLAYDKGRVDEADVATADDLRPWLERGGILWINVDGLGDADELRRIADLLGTHRLVLEDILNVHQRPKVEDYGEYLYIVCRTPDTDPNYRFEQISLVVTARVVVTFQERAGDCFDPLRRWLREGKGRFAERGADFLAYAVIDAMIDAFYPLVETYDERLERLEDEAVQRPRRETIIKIHDIKRELVLLRRVLWPTREMVSNLLRDSTPIVTDATRVYLRDCYDHAAQLLDILESYREVTSGLMDVYLSTLSNRMNEVMKVLTVIATIFIPLTFIAGVYGMNFDTEVSPWNMPELEWYFGYPLCLALMAAVAIALLVWFRRRGWIGGVGKRS